MESDNFTFSITVLVVGMGGTLVALTAISLLMSLLKLVFRSSDNSSESSIGGIS
ncbi:MAG: hypothetical protein GX230_10735 [Lentisphaerae bacterium]|jgi:hypothetical protein|nr:hypothetical protein [Lentisphaerota bacterium]